jgi:hypothetical protein
MEQTPSEELKTLRATRHTLEYELENVKKRESELTLLLHRQHIQTLGEAAVNRLLHLADHSDFLNSLKLSETDLRDICEYYQVKQPDYEDID